MILEKEKVTEMLIDILPTDLYNKIDINYIHNIDITFEFLKDRSIDEVIKEDSNEIELISNNKRYHIKFNYSDPYKDIVWDIETMLFNHTHDEVTKYII